MNQLETIETEVAGQRALFDYGALDQETQVLVRLRAGEIKSLAKRVAADIVEIGGKLAEVKDRVGGNGKFNEWLSAELGWSERTAYNFIAVWQRFSAANFALENVATSALYLLAAPSTPAEAVEAAKQIADSGEKVTHEVAKEIVRQAKARKPKQVELIEGPEEVDEETEPDEGEEADEVVDVRTCRVCGCTEADCRRCVERAGAPCVWIGPDLCSACAKPVRVPVPQLVLDTMHKRNSAVAIDRGEPAHLFQLGDEWLVITDATRTVTHGVTFATGWRVVPEADAGDIRQRSHPSELVDEIAGYAESFFGVRVNARTTDKPEWWVVVGPEYEFDQFKEAPEATPAAEVTPGAESAQKRAPVEKPPAGHPAAWFKTRVEILITLMPGPEPRKIMHTVRAGDGKDDIPFVAVSSGEAELLDVLPPITRGLYEKAYEAFAKKQAAKPAAKKSTPKSKPAPKKRAAKKTNKGGKK
jgi:DUF3102 family protein